jgi:hypothetical protein
MIRPKLILAAETVIRDAITNLISVINIQEQFYPVGYPLLIPSFVVLVIFERDQTDPPDIRARLAIRLDNEVVIEQDVAVNFGHALMNRSVIRLQSMVIEHAGSITARVTVQDQSLDSYLISAFPAGARPQRPA